MAGLSSLARIRSSRSGMCPSARCLSLPTGCRGCKGYRGARHASRRSRRLPDPQGGHSPTSMSARSPAARDRSASTRYSSGVQHPWYMQVDAGGRVGIADLVKQLIRLLLPIATAHKAVCRLLDSGGSAARWALGALFAQTRAQACVCPAGAQVCPPRDIGHVQSHCVLSPARETFAHCPTGQSRR